MSSHVARIVQHPLFWAVCAALLLRIVLLWMLPFPDQSGGDYVLYRQAAEHIVRGEGFGDITFIAPLWPILLAGSFLFFGSSLGTTLLVHFILMVLLVVIGYAFARRVLSHSQHATYVAFGIALWPPFALEVLSFGDPLTLYSVVLLFASYCLVVAAYDQKPMFGLLTGLCLAGASLTDTLGFYAPLIFLVALFLLVQPFRVNLRRTIATGMLLIIGFTLGIAPWVYRNIERFGGTEEAPIIVKFEEDFVLNPKTIYSVTRPFANRDLAVIGSAVGKIFFVPYGLFRMHGQTDRSYKNIIADIISPDRSISLSSREGTFLGIKVGLTFLHVLLLVCAAIGFFVAYSRWKVLLLLLLVYTTIAVIGFGSLGNNDFQNISQPSSFLVPFIPFLLICALEGAHFLRGHWKRVENRV